MKKKQEEENEPKFFFLKAGVEKKPPFRPPLPPSLFLSLEKARFRWWDKEARIAFFHPFRSISLVTQVLHFLSLHLSHDERKNFFFAHTHAKNLCFKLY